MKADRDREELLEAVLAEGEPNAMHESLLEGALRQVRRSRRRRKAGRFASGVAVVLGIAAVLWWNGAGAGRDVEPKPNSRELPGCTIVRTGPLPDAARVATRPLEESRIVSSVPFRATVHTLAGQVRFIGDTELLALVGPRAAIVRAEGEPARLIFTDKPAAR